MVNPMRQADSQDRWQPLIVPSDPLIRKPLAPWRARLVQGLGQALVQPALDVPRVVILLNQLALLEAYRGATGAALAVCDAQIRFWRNHAAQPGQSQHLGAVVQPWINMIRLERWRAHLDRSMALYRELAPAQRATCGSLQQRYGIALAFDALDRLEGGDGIARLLDVTFWREYGNVLFDAGRHAELQLHLQGGMRQGNEFLRVTMLELLLVNQVNLGNHAGALSVLRRLPLRPAMTHWLPFKTLEMVAVQRSGGSGFAALVDSVVAGALATADADRDQRDLVLLVDVARVCAKLGLEAEELALLRAAQAMARAMDDEVLGIEVLRRLCARGQEDEGELRQRCAASDYALVRRQIGLAPSDPGTGPDVVGALRALAASGIDACLASLARAPTCAAAAYAM
jgi:hypothetical protein